MAKSFHIPLEGIKYYSNCNYVRRAIIPRLLPLEKLIAFLCPLLIHFSYIYWLSSDHFIIMGCFSLFSS